MTEQAKLIIAIVFSSGGLVALLKWAYDKVLQRENDEADALANIAEQQADMSEDYEQYAKFWRERAKEAKESVSRLKEQNSLLKEQNELLREKLSKQEAEIDQMERKISSLEQQNEFFERELNQTTNYLEKLQTYFRKRTKLISVLLKALPDDRRNKLRDDYNEIIESLGHFEQDIEDAANVEND